MFDKIHEECGVFGIFDDSGINAAESAYYALYALQHRGQESCGIAVNDSGTIRIAGDSGLVSEVFTEDAIKNLAAGCASIGHVRYGVFSTAAKEELQPLLVTHVKGKFALCNNGSLSNYKELREQLELNGFIFHTESDAELISGMLIHEMLESSCLEDALLRIMAKMEGAYSLLIMTDDRLIAVRDPWGFRPLCIGRTSGGYAFASESCALDSIHADFLRDVAPGEIVTAGKTGISSITAFCDLKQTALCIFEYIYFSRPDSVVDGVSVHHTRHKAGQFLAEDYPTEADVVIGVPDSGIDAAIGYSAASGIPYGLGFVKNKYIGRTFIQPNLADREDKVRIKLNPMKNVVKGKRVVLVDDSIVRGTTCGRIVRLLRQAEAAEVHLRVSSPPFLHPCYFGTDIDSEEKLIAHKHSKEEIGKLLDADSIEFLRADRLEDMAKACRLGFCTGCFTGKYPCYIPK